MPNPRSWSLRVKGGLSLPRTIAAGPAQRRHEGLRDLRVAVCGGMEAVGADPGRVLGRGAALAVEVDQDGAVARHHLGDDRVVGVDQPVQVGRSRDRAVFANPADAPVGLQLGDR